MQDFETETVLYVCSVCQEKNVPVAESSKCRGQLRCGINCSQLETLGSVFLKLFSTHAKKTSAEVERGSAQEVALFFHPQ